ncbi:MAG: hypothetical protein NTW21_28860 [Verrucomicrobia bacterium]|nr:hypothetical protein [Verrucomicrobiota bacterium]
MKIYSSITSFALAVGLAGPLSAGTILQWGFEFTSGAVSVPITDDSGAGHPGTALLGNGAATYSADIPSALETQNVTGIGSVNFATGSTTAIATPQYTPPRDGGRDLGRRGSDDGGLGEKSRPGRCVPRFRTQLWRYV